MQEPQESDALIAIVDDDPSVRRGLQRLILTQMIRPNTYHHEGVVDFFSPAMRKGKQQYDTPCCSRR